MDVASCFNDDGIVFASLDNKIKKLAVIEEFLTYTNEQNSE